MGTGRIRDDIYYALCYDAAGVKTYLQVVLDSASLRAQGMSPSALKSEIEKRFRDKTYQPPAKPGLSYMVGPIMRTIGPPDLAVRTMAMPHLMFYAPNLTNEDIGAVPNLADHASLLYPFVNQQGIAEHTYMIQLIGESEKARILADEKPLVDALCAYRQLLLPVARLAPLIHPQTIKPENDHAHNWHTKGMARRTARVAQGREGSHPPQRRTGQAAPGPTLGTHR